MTEPTLSFHAETWWKDRGLTVPERHSENWWDMYEEWIEYAFNEIVGDYEPVEDLAEGFEEAWCE